MIVLKFGGRTISTPERIERCLDLIQAQTDRNPLVVVSAHGDTTDRLLEAARSAQSGKVRTGNLREYHLELAAECGAAPGLITPLLDRLESLLHGIGLLRELTPRTQDHVLSFGEQLSSRMVAAALSARGLRARPVCAFDIGLTSDSRFGNASLLPESAEQVVKKLSGVEEILVVTGYIAKNQKGEITTLGRSGTDYTATFIAGAVDAQEVVIFKDVDGVMTADPGLDPRAKNLPELSFEEASELAYFGAEVLHPATLLPAILKNIPVRVVNARKENDPGTLIMARPAISDRIAKSVVYKEDVTLYHLLSPRLHSVPRVLNDALASLEREDIVAQMITTSEAGISLITQSGLTPAKIERACKRLTDIAQVTCTPCMGIICMVGEELRGRAESVGRIFQSLAQAAINPRVITRSASEINLAFLVAENEIPDAVRAMHSLILE